MGLNRPLQKLVVYPNEYTLATRDALTRDLVAGRRTRLREPAKHTAYPGDPGQRSDAGREVRNALRHVFDGLRRKNTVDKPAATEAEPTRAWRDLD